MNLTLRVSLQPTRSKLGAMKLLAEDGSLVAGPFPCLAIADNAAALKHGNRDRDPLKPFGDTPLGIYKGVIYPPSPDVDTYGPGKRILLVPESGPCVQAETIYKAPNGTVTKEARDALAMHGGKKNPAYTPWQGLRPTYGCIRADNDDLGEVVEKVEERAATLTVEVLIDAELAQETGAA